MTREWPPYRTVRELIHRHEGRPAVVIGGGPSAPAGLARCPAEAIAISANEHGLKLRACDFITSLDRIEGRLRPLGAPIVSRHLFADYRVLVWPQPSSGILGAWLARLLGCEPIYLVGMDCFDGKTYFHDPAAKSSGFAEYPRQHLARWRAFLGKYPAHYIAHACHIEKYVEAAVVAPAPKRDRLETELEGEIVRISKNTTFTSLGIERPFSEGDVIEVSPREATELLRLRKASRVRKEARRA